MKAEITLTEPTTPWEFEQFIARLTEFGTVVEEISYAVIKVSR